MKQGHETIGVLAAVLFFACAAGCRSPAPAELTREGPGQAGVGDSQLPDEARFAAALPTEELVRVAPPEWRPDFTPREHALYLELGRRVHDQPISREHNHIVLRRHIESEIRRGDAARVRPVWPKTLPLRARVCLPGLPLTSYPVVFRLRPPGGPAWHEVLIAPYVHDEPPRDWRDQTVAVPWEPAAGPASIPVEADYLDADADGRPAEPQRARTLGSFSLETRFVDSIEEAIDAVDTPALSRRLAATTKVTLFEHRTLNAVFHKARVEVDPAVLRGHPGMALGLRLSLDEGGEPLARWCCVDGVESGGRLVFILELGGDTELLSHRLDQGGVALRLTGDPEMALLDFDRAQYWSGSILVRPHTLER